MHRWLIVFVVVFVGCVASLPSDDVTVSADLAAEAARLAVQLRHEIPPSPVTPSTVCENCNGTGKVGDGTIMHDCMTCGGTGQR